MTCEEFEQTLADKDDRNSHADSKDINYQTLHLQSCSACSDLVADFDAISVQALTLRETDEPSPRVWNSIEIALRHEGLIRDSKPAIVSVPIKTTRHPWRAAWLVPVAALLLLAFGLKLRNHPSTATAQLQGASDVVSAPVSYAGLTDDQQLLSVVSQHAPAMRASYEANLQDVNSYIRDAEASVKRDPNDEQARQYLMNAYEQKTMVYQMVLDRSAQ